MAKLILKKNEERRLKAGHLWVFSNEIADISGEPENGDVVVVFDSKGNLLGHGFYNKNSLIACRLLCGYSGDFYSYCKFRIAESLTLRKTFYPARDSFRLVFSESDFLPGLIIDKYNNTFVLQVYSLGMQKHIHHIVRALKEEFSAQNIFTMNDTYFRSLEGLGAENEIYLGSVNEEMISDGKLKYKINFMHGQKTGFYFDQSDNREFIEKFVKGRTVLDAFCYSGGFGMHAALAGASSVTFVDSSDHGAKENYELNSLSAPAEFIHSDVFDYLEQCIGHNDRPGFPTPLGRGKGRGTFDIVMLDPPAFSKSKKSLSSALKGYTKLNKLALLLIPSGGFLITSSCSHHVSREDFINALNTASSRAGKNIQLLHFAGASLDHPVLPSMPETSYLKFSVLKVM